MFSQLTCPGRRPTSSYQHAEPIQVRLRGLTTERCSLTEIVVDQQATTVGRPRRRLPADWDVDDFINWANANEIRYVVLRWFETLPDLRDGEDIDILVADDSVE